MIGKQDLVQRVANDTGMSRAQAEKFYNSMLDQVASALSSGEEVRLTGFGSFKVAQRGERRGRNPRTGEEVRIPASKRPSFSAGSKLVAAVRGEAK